MIWKAGTAPMVTKPLSPLSLLERAPLFYSDQVLPSVQADQLFDTLLDTLIWHVPAVTVYGKRHPVPRQVAWCADIGVDYAYAGHCHQGSGWPPSLYALKSNLETLCATSFNAVLVNRYDHGGHCMGYHRDNEPELGASPWIASYTLGAARDFTFRPWARSGAQAGRQCAKIPLGHNSVLLMSPECQQHYEHALPRRAQQQGIRLNLTFRLVQPKNK